MWGQREKQTTRGSIPRTWNHNLSHLAPRNFIFLKIIYNNIIICALFTHLGSKPCSLFGHFVESLQTSSLRESTPKSGTAEASETILPMTDIYGVLIISQALLQSFIRTINLILTQIFQYQDYTHFSNEETRHREIK